MGRTYREYHTSLMHTNGTTAYETLGAVLPSFIYQFIGTSVASLLLSYVTKKKLWQFLLEFCLIVIPTILHITVLSNHISTVITSVIIVIISIILLFNSLPSSVIKPVEKQSSRKPYITNCRAATNLSTVLAILAVDFQIFPRRFAKTETFGFSLMDVGVGLFIYSNAIIAPEIRGRRDSIKKSFKSCIPLFILGATRFFLTKETDYQVPVSEYGVHWNFFITLAITKIFTSFIMNVINVKYIYINAIFLILAHEILLQSGLANLVLHDTKRSNLILANKEGLVSSLGYVSLYLFSVYFGYFLYVKSSTVNKIKTICKIFILSFFLITLTLILQHYLGISRRLANSAYCFWILFLGIFMTGLYFVGEVIHENIYSKKFKYCVYTSYIFDAINYNGLAYFLLSNVLTGLINICLQTLNMNTSISLIILIIYMFVSCLVMCILYNKQIKLQIG